MRTFYAVLGVIVGGLFVASFDWSPGLGARYPAGPEATILPMQYKPGEIVVPKYGAGYIGPDGATDDRLTRIETKIDALTRDLAIVVGAVKQQQAAAAQEAADDTEIKALLTVCASCHGSAVAASKGNGYAMFNDKGEFVRSSARDLRNQVKRLNSQSPDFMMPPPAHAGKVSPERRAKFTAAALADAAAQEQNSSGK